MSFRLKLVLSFLIVILVGFAAVYTFTSFSMVQQFSRFTSERFRNDAQRIAPLFVLYHQQNGSWDQLEEILRIPEPQDEASRALDPARRGPPLANFQLMRVLREELILTDASGTVVFDYDRQLLGRQLDAVILEQGVDLYDEGEKVGTLLSSAVMERFSPLAQEFLRSLDRSTLIASGIAALLSLGMIALLVRHFGRPLNALTQASKRIAAGQLGAQVEVNAQDDLGRLAQSFNTMSAKLKQSEELRQQMTVDIAHELRTPVSVIKGDMEALVDGVYAPEPETFQSLLEETQRLSRLIDDLHELSLLEAGELRLERRPTDLQALTQQLTGVFARQAEAGGVALCLESGPALPPVVADADRIAQVLRNLLSNALRHTPEGGRVSVTLSRRGSEARCAVRDTGPGLAPAEAEQVFERFWRADHSRARHSGGSGLGLSISRRLVEAHGGRMWLETAPGAGSTFGFSLPLQPAPGAAR